MTVVGLAADGTSDGGGAAGDRAGSGAAGGGAAGDGTAGGETVRDGVTGTANGRPAVARSPICNMSSGGSDEVESPTHFLSSHPNCPQP